MLAMERGSPRQADVIALLAQSDAFSAARYPPEENYPVDSDFLGAPGVLFFVAREDGRAAGCAALVIGRGGQAEIKRMVVDEAARGRGIGRALLAALERAAAQNSVSLIQLETGTLSEGALALYSACGFQRRGPFGDYTAGAYSVFMEKALG